MSLPSWERGLKYKIVNIDCVLVWSLPSWERGLKLDVATGNSKTAEVAPLVGAWIEIHNTVDNRPVLRSLPSWERGLKSAQ